MNKQSPKSTLLLIGGLAMRSNEFSSLIVELKKMAEANFISFDNFNVGSGPRLISEERPLSILDQANHQWNKISSFLDLNSEKISIFGISMGGMIASTMACAHPERVDKLILAATSANFPESPAIPDFLYRKWIEAKTGTEIWDAVEIAFGKTTLSETPQVPRDYFRYRTAGGNGQTSKEFKSQLDSIRNFQGERIYNILQQQKIDLTVLDGEEDVLFGSQHLDDIKSKIPNANFVTLLKTGHMLHLENPLALAKAINDSLKS